MRRLVAGSDSSMIPPSAASTGVESCTSDALTPLNPRSARIQTMRGQALMSAGRKDDAAEAFKKALKIDPDDQGAIRGYKEATGQ